eukprot:3113856-Rhodomonas_salina.2
MSYLQEVRVSDDVEVHHGVGHDADLPLDLPAPCRVSHDTIHRQASSPSMHDASNRNLDIKAQQHGCSIQVRWSAVPGWSPRSCPPRRPPSSRSCHNQPRRRARPQCTPEWQRTVLERHGITGAASLSCRESSNLSNENTVVCAIGATDGTSRGQEQDRWISITASDVPNNDLIPKARQVRARNQSGGNLNTPLLHRPCSSGVTRSFLEPWQGPGMQTQPPLPRGSGTSAWSRMAFGV